MASEQLSFTNGINMQQEADSASWMTAVFTASKKTLQLLV